MLRLDPRLDKLPLEHIIRILCTPQLVKDNVTVTFK